MPWSPGNREIGLESQPSRSSATWRRALLITGLMFLATFAAFVVSRTNLWLLIVFTVGGAALLFVLLLKEPQYTVPFIIAAIPLEIWKSFYPFLRVETEVDHPAASIVELWRVVLLLALVAVVLSSLFRGRLSIVRHRVVWRSGILLLLFVLSSLFLSPSPSRAAIETARLAAHLALFALVAGMTTSLPRLERALQVFVLTAIGISLLGIYQFFTGRSLWPGDVIIEAVGRVNATVYDPNILARYLAVSIIACVALLEIRPMSILPAAALVGVPTVALLLTQSRSGWVLLPIGTVILWWWSTGRARLHLGRITVALAVGMGIAFVYVPAFAARFGTFSEGLGALGARVALINTGVQIFQDHMLVGAGLGSFQTVALSEYADLLPFGGTYATLSHSALVTVMAELGIVGLVVTALVFGSVFRSFSAVLHTGSSETRWYALGCFAGIVLVVISAQAEGRMFEDPLLWVLMGLLVGLERLCRPRPHRSNERLAAPSHETRSSRP